MLYHISLLLKNYWVGFNVIHYVSFRAIAALISAFFLSLIFGARFIDKTKIVFRSRVRPWTPESHKVKDNLPTMGGVFILGVVLITSLVWCNLLVVNVWIFLATLIGFGALGFWDDWCKIRHLTGISAATKFFVQVAIGLFVVLVWLMCKGASTSVVLPFFKNVRPDLGWLFIPWALLVIIGSSNAVNLTDGLDGLAIGSLMPNFALFSLICYLAGNIRVAAYLHIPFTGAAEIAVIGATLFGASLGFLWYNTYPAQIFMGDVGSLALGAGLGMMALMAKQEILLILAGGLFVVEVASVIIQVFSYKLFGRRIFKMAPLHHHFELMGWQESKITVRFAIISFVLCLFALITLKLR